MTVTIGKEKFYSDESTIKENNLYTPITIKEAGQSLGYFKNNNFIKVKADHLGSLIETKDLVQNINTPYGERDNRTGEDFNIIDFTLKSYDRDLQAIRMGRRYYDPKAKLFLTPDSYFIENINKCVQRVIDCNLYSYAINNPVLYSDPTGDAPPLDKNSKITSDYGPRNIEQGSSKHHNGTDLRAAKGSKVFAVADGFVYASGPPKKGEKGGTRVKIRHVDGSYSVSRHIKPIAKVGKIKEGQLIGITCTGSACGTKEPHLHFERTKPNDTKPTNAKDFLIKEFEKMGFKLDAK